MTKRKPTPTFVEGDRVVFNATGEMLDMRAVAGTIIKVSGHIALIRPDTPLFGTVVVTTRPLRDLEKEIV